jgi:hypothetical protein
MCMLTPPDMRTKRQSSYSSRNGFIILCSCSTGWQLGFGGDAVSLFATLLRCITAAALLVVQVCMYSRLKCARLLQ